MPTSKDITLNIAHNKLLHVKALVAEILQTSVKYDIQYQPPSINSYWVSQDIIMASLGGIEVNTLQDLEGDHDKVAALTPVVSKSYLVSP